MSAAGATVVCAARGRRRAGPPPAAPAALLLLLRRRRRHHDLPHGAGARRDADAGDGVRLHRVGEAPRADVPGRDGAQAEAGLRRPRAGARRRPHPGLRRGRRQRGAPRHPHPGPAPHHRRDRAGRQVQVPHRARANRRLRQAADRQDRRLHPATRPDPDEQRLVLEGEDLDDRHLIHDVCRADGAVIHLLVQRSSAKISAAEADGGFEVSIVARDAGQQLPRRDVGIEPVVVGNPKEAAAQLPSAVRDMIDAAVAGMENGNAPIMSSEGTGSLLHAGRGGAPARGSVQAGGRGAHGRQQPARPPRVVHRRRAQERDARWGGRAQGGRGLHPRPPTRRPPPVDRRRWRAWFAGVPPTALVRCTHKAFRQPEASPLAPPPVPKLGSMQAFVSNCGSCEDMGPRAFPVQEVHKICVLDIRLANADRHAGNILVCKHDDGGMSLVPIDHGYCLPESVSSSDPSISAFICIGSSSSWINSCMQFEDCTFEWLYWPQCRQPFGEETVEYVRSLDAEEDIAMLRLHGWEVSRECARTLRVATMLLKKGVERGLAAFDIGSILCRETLTKESAIEEIVREAEAQRQRGGGCDDDETAFISEVMDSRLDEIPPAGAKVI
ncbi:unnamed protein product [Miscanthus lutarioriparius]|uniref:1-phosphatidylinositol 4-kinase n=1 Tax=Miscanthus lutarioriparius TaxID=422564 RepID=A0A811RUS8_9POAL|nr:unnamed protein product [Miscanthus lutarioriparius]